MRVKRKKLVVTFATTAQVMRCETICQKEQLEGRIIPVPKEITAGCGLAWKAHLEDRQNLEQALKDNGVRPEGVHEIILLEKE